MGGVYDVHTNTMHHPQITQPTHVRYERVAPGESHGTAQLMSDLSSLSLANQGPTITDLASHEKRTTGPPTSDDKPDAKTDEQPSTIFPPVPASVSNRYVVQDIIYQSPPYSNMGIPGPDGDLRTMNPNGITSLVNSPHPEFMTPEIIALLPEDCKKAFDEAVQRELEWKKQWSTEAEDGARSRPLKSYAWYP